jgi:hypothetical protein
VASERMQYVYIYIEREGPQFSSANLVCKEGKFACSCGELDLTPCLAFGCRIGEIPCHMPVSVCHCHHGMILIIDETLSHLWLLVKKDRIGVVSCVLDE